MIQNTCSVQSTRDKHLCTLALVSQHVQLRIQSSQSSTRLGCVMSCLLGRVVVVAHVSSRVVPFHFISFHSILSVGVHASLRTSHRSTALSHSPPIERGFLPCTYRLNSSLHITSVGNTLLASDNRLSMR